MLDLPQGVLRQGERKSSQSFLSIFQSVVLNLLLERSRPLSASGAQEIRRRFRLLNPRAEPALREVDDVFIYRRTNTDVGMFEVVHSGASGAMRSFAQRGMTQDQMLLVLAYVKSLKK
ncbi:MAG TPA: hypothetical protein PKD49_08240 [Hyphomicrobium sp.]|nr:hypothetical protein [Hyphomicrobium sp.]